MQYNKTKYHKSNLYALLYKQAVTESLYNWVSWTEKLISAMVHLTWPAMVYFKCIIAKNATN